MENLFSQISKDSSEEVFTPLVENPSLKLESIVSCGQATPAGRWLCQDRAEWVVVLRGRAGLSFQGETSPRVLEPGHYVHIPAGTRHRVEWTDPTGPTVWLALHYTQ